jgi:hypothetical protein
VHLDQNLVGTSLGVGDLADLELGGTGGRDDLDGAHALEVIESCA